MISSIVLIGNTRTESARRLQEEAGRQGLTFDLLPSKYLNAPDQDLSNGAERPGFDFGAYDLYYFRAPLRRQWPRVRSWAKLLHQNSKRVVEHILTQEDLPEDKLPPPSIQGCYQLPRSQLTTLQEVEKHAPKLQFPLVAKHLQTSRGRGVRLIRSRQELDSFPESKTEPILLQQYYQLEWDMRVLVVGDQALGGLKRYLNSQNEVLTTARGGHREKARLTQAEVQAAVEATERQGLEIAGVDMFPTPDTPCVLEVNSSPQFLVFEKHTGINAAKEMIKYFKKADQVDRFYSDPASDSG